MYAIVDPDIRQGATSRGGSRHSATEGNLMFPRISRLFLHWILGSKSIAKLDGGMQGWRPRGRLGDGPCIRPPNSLRSSVVGCARKYEQRKKIVIRNFFRNSCFFCEERVIYDT